MDSDLIGRLRRVADLDSRNYPEINGLLLNAAEALEETNAAYAAVRRDADRYGDALREIAKGDRMTGTKGFAEMAYQQVVGLARAAVGEPPARRTEP